MSESYISTQNKIVEFGATATGDGGQDPDFPAANTLDGLTWTVGADTPGTAAYSVIYDFGFATAANCAGMAGFTLGDSGSRILVQWSDNGTDWTTFVDITTTRKNSVFQAVATVETHQYWRYSLIHEPGATAGRPGFAVAWLGAALRMEQQMRGPFQPPSYDFNNRLLQNFGGGGALLGTGVIRQGGSTSYEFKDLTWDFFENSLSEHYDRLIQGKPFMFTWDNVNHPDKAAYSVAPNNPTVNYRTHGRMDFTIPALTL